MSARVGWGVLLLVTIGCGATRPATTSATTPRSVPARTPDPAPRVFRGAELDAMRARAGLVGAAYGFDCHCLAIEAASGHDEEATALRCDDCSGIDLAEGDPAKCNGQDSSGETRRGAYVCREFSLGPRKGSGGSAATLK